MSLKSEMKVVIVDDSDFSRVFIKNILSEEGIEVVGEADNAETALIVVKDKQPNIVITDIVMPEISGIELTEKITQNFNNVAVVVISSLSQEHIILESIGAGASDFIAKPVDRRQLVDSLEKIMQQLKV
jgi:two-component system chemotaxis response regulator CheY